MRVVLHEANPAPDEPEVRIAFRLDGNGIIVEAVGRDGVRLPAGGIGRFEAAPATGRVLFHAYTHVNSDLFEVDMNHKIKVV